MNCTLFDPVVSGAIAAISCTSPGDPWWRITIAIVTPVLVLLSAVIAWRSLRNARSVARQKATLDLIEKAESTDHYRKLSTGFATVKREGRFDALHDPVNDQDRRDRQNVLDYLNHYELVAIGIAHDILDETIYRAWMQSHVVMEWNAAAAFIQAERWRLNAAGTDHEYHASLFSNLQRIACRWSSDAKVLNAGSSPKPPLPTGPVAPGDVPLPDVEPVDEAGKLERVRGIEPPS